MTALPETERGAPVSPRRILVVDDDEDILLMIKRLLTARGYECDVARNGQEALDSLEADPFWLVVLDVMMPVIDGMEVADRVRDDPRLGGPHVVFVTGRGDVAPSQRHRATDRTTFLTKPFSPSKLVEAIRDVEELG